MSAFPGKVLIDGVVNINGEKLFALQFLQARNPDWVRKPFYAKFDDKATWLDELVPAFGQKRFFFETEDAHPVPPPGRVIQIHPTHHRDGSITLRKHEEEACAHEPDAA